MKPPHSEHGKYSFDRFSPALRYSIIYALAGCIWFVASNQLHNFLAITPADEARVDLFLETLFVGTTALLFFFRLKRYGHEDFKQDDLSSIARWKLSRSTLLAMLIFLLSIGGIGISLYLSIKKQLAMNATSNLESIAKLKTGQIESWLGEARNDANITLRTPSFRAALQTWLDNGKRDGEYREALRTRLQELASIGHFRDVSLYDPAGNLLLTTATSANSRNNNHAMAAAQQDTTLLDEFHIEETGDGRKASVGYFIPVHATGKPHPIAALHVSLQPYRLLYPLLQKWPGTSHSAESLLVRRDGDELVYLNTLRHRSAPPLSLRLPLTAPNLIAVKALAGPNGGISGVDYRNQPSLAYSMPVPGTSWHIVSKIDEDEVFATLDSIAKFAAAMVAIQLLAAGLWLSDYYRSMSARYRAQADRLLLSNRIETLVKHANDCIIMFDANKRIIDANDRCLSTYGYSREEMLALTRADLTGENTDELQAMLQQCNEEDRLLYTTHHRRKDGSVFPVEISMVAMDVGGVRRTQEIIRDISEREMSNAHIMRLSQLYATLSTVNQAIARGTNIDEVFSTACHACVEHGGLVVAWIGQAGPEDEDIAVSHSYGIGLGYLENICIGTRADMPAGRGPTEIAFREQRAYVCNDFANDPATLPWRSQAARYAIRAAIALPIRRDGVTVGVLTAYSDKKNFFDAQTEHLLREIAESLSFAMHHFAENEVRRKIEAELRQSEELLHEAQGIARIGHWQYDLETRAYYWSPQMYRLFERDPAQGPAVIQDADAYYARDSAQALADGFHKAIISGQRIELELQAKRPGNRIIHQAAVIIPLCNEQGRAVMVRGTFQDITEHKLNEQRLQDATQTMLEYAQEIEDLYQNAPCGYHSLDQNGVFQRINETELKWLGYSRDEMIGKMSFKDLLDPGYVPRFHETFPRLKEIGEVHDVEMELICKDGKRLPVLVNASAIRDKNRRFLMTRSTLYNMTERRKMENERLEYSRRLENLSRRLVSAQEKGRRNLSAALHDQTSPNLAAIEINLSLITELIPGDRSPEVAALLDDTSALLKDTTISIREICAELRPSLLDYAGLVPALEGYAHQFAKRTGTAVRLNCTNPATKLGTDKESLLFRVVQEAMTNCAKHANASAIEVMLKQGDGSTVLTIADDGIGFNPEQIGKNGKSTGLGVLNMREISEFIGGKFTIASSPGKGTSVSVEL